MRDIIRGLKTINTFSALKIPLFYENKDLRDEAFMLPIDGEKYSTVHLLGSRNTFLPANFPRLWVR